MTKVLVQMTEMYECSGLNAKLPSWEMADFGAEDVAEDEAAGAALELEEVEPLVYSPCQRQKKKNTRRAMLVRIQANQEEAPSQDDYVRRTYGGLGSSLGGDGSLFLKAEGLQGLLALNALLCAPVHRDEHEEKECPKPKKT